VTPTQAFIAGAIGAIAPEIVRLYEMRSDPTVRFSGFYIVVSIAYVALGGYVATIFPGIDSQFWAACVGAGLVLVVNKMVHIGGLLANGVAGLVKGAPKEAGSTEGGFGRRAAPAAVTPRQGGFLDYIAKL
jgi:hypothetical protein